jgi:hypothetical protein
MLDATMARIIARRLEEGIGSAKTEASMARVIAWCQEGGIGNTKSEAEKAKQAEEQTEDFVAYYKHQGKSHKPAGKGIANTSQLQRKIRSIWLYLPKLSE